MLWVLALILFILWVLGFVVFHVAGALIHLLLVIAVIVAKHREARSHLLPLVWRRGYRVSDRL